MCSYIQLLRRLSRPGSGESPWAACARLPPPLPRSALGAAGDAEGTALCCAQGLQLVELAPCLTVILTAVCVRQGKETILQIFARV